jgi:hypothetical protein
MKLFRLSTTAVALTLSLIGSTQTLTPIPYGNFNSWVVREIKESPIIGGKTKTVYAIGPNDTIKGGIPYKNASSSPWATSNIMAKVMGITKCSNAVFPDTRSNNDRCVKLTTILEGVKAIGIINIKVLVSGSIFLGEMLEPISSTKSPYSKMEMGIPFDRRPTHLVFDYKVSVPDDNRMMYCSGFSPRKQLDTSDNAEVYIILQRRWEDSDGNLHALRVGTGRERFNHTTPDWVNAHKLPVLYGDITQHPDYKPFMGLISGEKAYYARNSRGKMVPVQEEGWDDANATPTHMLIMASSGCGTAYEGTVGMTLWLDNIALQY